MGLPRNMEEFDKLVKAKIDDELEKTPPDMKLNVHMTMEKEGLRLEFTRTPIQEEE